LVCYPLPTGSHLVAVEGFLDKRGFESSFDSPSKILYAVARKLKGSPILVSESLELKFYFDEALNLKSISQEVIYTGP
jgi:hypothetical protein